MIKHLLGVLSKINSINKCFSIYVHWPYCESKCTYCSFNKYINPKILDHERFKNAFLNELKHSLTQYKGMIVNSVYFGGGTPTLAQPSTFEAILDYISKECILPKNCEITIEGNPTSIEISKLKDFKKIGFNRVSLGLQSLNDQDLKTMGRDHNSTLGLKALETTSSLFENFTFDMIFGRPKQTLEDWKKELKTALSFTKDHISIYQLMIEPGTPFYKLHKNNRLPLPPSKNLEDMYYATVEMMDEEGFEHYEVSSYCRNKSYGKHNLGYWRGLDYIGIGPGAHGRVIIENNNSKRISTYRILSPERWLNQCESLGHGLAKVDNMTIDDVIKERIVLGLRTKRGVNLAELKKLIEESNIMDISLVKEPFIKSMLNNFISAGFLTRYKDNYNEEFLAPTEKGLAVIDSILLEILND